MSFRNAEVRSAVAFWLIVCEALLIVAIAGYFAYVTNAQNKVLAQTARNEVVESIRSGVDGIVCILAIDPEKRTDENIQQCLRDSGYLKERTTP